MGGLRWGVGAPQRECVSLHSPREKVGTWEEMPIFGVKDDCGFFLKLLFSESVACQSIRWGVRAAESRDIWLQSSSAIFIFMSKGKDRFLTFWLLEV